MSYKVEPKVSLDESAEIQGLSEKGSPVNADIVVIEDSADAYSKKKVQLGNLPGGGGGGETITTEYIASLPTATSQDITHPAVSMTYTSEAIDASSWALVPGDSGNDWTMGFEVEPNILYDDRNVSGRSFTRSAAAIGEFDGAVDPGVQAYCKIKFVGNPTIYTIKTLTGDGTGIGSVELNADPGAGTFTVEYIHGFIGYNGAWLNREDLGSGYTVPKNYWYTFIFDDPNAFSKTEYPSGTDMSGWGAITSMRPSYSGYHTYPNQYVRYAISNDTGTTWYYYNGVAWVGFDGDVTNGKNWINAPTLTPVGHLLDAAAAVDAGGGIVTISCSGHTIRPGMTVTIAGTTNYNGDFLVTAITFGTSFSVQATYVPEVFGGAETVSYGPPQGLVDQSSGGLYDSLATTEITYDSAVWAAMPQPSGADEMRVRGAVFSNNDDWPPYSYVWSIAYDLSSFRRKMTPGYSTMYLGNSGDVEYRRVDTTTLRVTNMRSFDLTEMVVRIRTP